MTALETHDKVSPFTCSNTECAKTYEWNDFQMIANVFGFILLTNGETSLFGFTCPSCKKTTARQYSLSPDQIIHGWKLSEEFENFIPDFSSYVPGRVINCYKQYIKFPIESIEGLCQNTTESKIFQPPHQVNSFDYPEWFEEKSLSSVCEKDIERILEFENQNGKCLFPRIIATSSIYNLSEGFIKFIHDYPNIKDVLYDNKYKIIELMNTIAETHCNPKRCTDSSITIDEYQNLTCQFHLIRPNESPEKEKIVVDLLAQYMAQRNNFNFPQVCVNEFFNKYLKSLFYEKGYYRSKQYFLDSYEYEYENEPYGVDDDGDTNNNNNGYYPNTYSNNLLGRPDPYKHATLTANELAKRWGRDVNAILPYIYGGEFSLTAYRYDGVRIDIHNHPNLKIDLQDIHFLKSEVEEFEVIGPEVFHVKETDKKVSPPINKQVETSSITKKQPKKIIDPKEVAAAESTFPNVKIISQDSRIDEIKIKISKRAKLKIENSTFLILGETGTGKNLFINAIHEASGRKELIRIGCGEKPQTFESELFGYCKGSFTGANEDRKGALENINGGIIFFDEIGNLSLELQMKLLDVFQNRKFQRLGETKTKSFDATFVLATNANLEQMVINKEFKQDLYERFKTPQFTIPALRERKDDIPLLTEHIIEKFDEDRKKDPSLPKLSLTNECLDALMAYDWPGNIRELENEIKSIMQDRLADGNRSPITKKELNPKIQNEIKKKNGIAKNCENSDLDEIDQQIIYWRNELNGQNKITEKIAEKIGISKRSVERHLAKIRINNPSLINNK